MKRRQKGMFMNNRDVTGFTLGDIPAAIGLLTRLPITVDTTKATARGAAAAWAYPLVGALIGVILAAFVALFSWQGLPVGIIAALVLAISAIITGAMHEDGLADAADGLWGGWDRARRLEIMKDSRIGVYGVLTLALSLLIRWMGVTALIALDIYWGAFIAMGVLSRSSMVVLMTLMTNARQTGLSQSVGRPAPLTGCVAVGIAVLIAVLCGHWALVIAAGMTLVVCAVIAQAKIGGQTGDILGATQQVTEIVMLLVLIS